MNLGDNVFEQKTPYGRIRRMPELVVKVRRPVEPDDPTGLPG